MIDLAYAMAPSPGGGGNGGGIMSVLPLMMGMFAIMYFLIIRPQQKQARAREPPARDQEGATASSPPAGSTAPWSGCPSTP
jgi:hypothetical protein